MFDSQPTTRHVERAYSLFDFILERVEGEFILSPDLFKKRIRTFQQKNDSAITDNVVAMIEAV